MFTLLLKNGKQHELNFLNGHLIVLKGEFKNGISKTKFKEGLTFKIGPKYPQKVQMRYFGFIIFIL